MAVVPTPRYREAQVVEVKDDGTVLWGVPGTEGTHELSPALMQQFGLVERAREAINEHVDARAHPVSVRHGSSEGQEGVSEATRALLEAEAPARIPKTLGGHSDAWRWQFCQGESEEDDHWAIDNKPEVEAYRAAVADGSWDGKKRVEFQYIALPAYVIDAIARSI